ncbi:MAG: glycosyltransferase family 92 protein [Selenomonas sp.]|uniref:glycosyltransferase family 92 protein n=1 Tax=Selenomonas sp. TaxID=2053611 RepID=UPI0025D1B5C3|nr:glycosyltransferase family 92 protein [Selenomonas sp.]MCR5438558.1 glycosyltransferase family 92 protein [Selenomonas sp.]
MELKENKYLIFDSPKKVSVKYLIKRILAGLGRGAYSLLYIFTAPDYIAKKYTVSICAIFRDEGGYLQEWLEYHLLIGVDHFYLYNNFSQDNYREILGPYIEQGMVTLIDWPVPQGQMKAYADCVERFGCETNWIGFIDLDEYVVPNHDDNIKVFLERFRNRPLVLIYWLYFSSSGLLTRDRSKLLVEELTVSWKKYSNIGKLFFNTAYDYADDLPGNEHMHYRRGRIGRWVLPPVNVFDKVCLFGENPVSSDDMPVQINHYVVKSYEEFQEKTKKGDAVFKGYVKDENYFFEHDMRGNREDHHIFKYLIKLKLRLRSLKNNTEV